MVFVDDFDVGVGLDKLSGHITRTTDTDPNCARLVALHRQDKALDVQHDVRDIFHHPGQGGEFVFGTLHTDTSHRSPFNAGQQDPAEGVPHGGSEAAFKRLH